MPRVFASVWLLLAFVAAVPAAAQGRVSFDRRAHLDAYEEITFSEFADLYDLAPFLAAEGTLVDDARLAELRSAWAAERERVVALLEAERADPKRWALFLLDRALARHGFFSQISWTRLDDVDGFVVYVQTPKKDDPDYAARTARENAARLLALREHFRTEYVEPAGLVRRDDFGTEVLFVLSSYADLATYGRLSGAAPHYRAQACYDGKLRAAVLFEDPFDMKTTRADKERSARHAYAHLLLHAYEGKLHSPVQEDWLREGFASYLADLEPDASGRLAAAEPPDAVLKELVAATQSQDMVLTHYRRIGDLYALPTYQHVGARAQVDAKKVGRDPGTLDMQGIYMCYWRESLLLVDFLHRGERRAGFLRLLADELRGEGGVAAFHRAFPAATPDGLDRAFLEHLFAEHRRRLPQVAVSAAAIEAVLQEDASLAPVPPASTPTSVGAARGAPAAPAAPAALPEPAFEPNDLAPRDLSPEAWLALCLDLARRGRSGDAEARLAQVLDAALDFELHARIARAHAQLAAWNRLRTGWVEALAASGDGYRFEHEGKTVRAGVERVEDGVVHLAENRSGRTRLELDALDPLELAKQVGKDADLHADGWARALPYALAGEKRAARMLDEADPDQAALASDLAGDLPGLLARGFPLGEMDELGRSPVPRDPAGCEEVLERLAALVRDHGDAAEVAALRPELRAYARLALEVVFDLAGTPQLVAGVWEALPRGRVRLTYEFEDAAELADFVRDDGYLQSRRPGLGELVGSRTEVKVSDGALIGLGQAVLRHKLGFAAPLSVRYELSFQPTEELGSAERWFVLVGICDDGRESYAGALGRLDLEVFEGPRLEAAIAEVRRPMYRNATYAMELAHDGAGKVTLTMDGEPMQELPAGALAGGGLLLLYHSDYYVRIKKLVIEGALDEALVARARAAWIDERMSERGL